MREQAELAPFVSATDRVVLFDGECVLCHGWAKFLINHDKQARFQLAALQSEEGQAILKHFELPAESFNSVVLVEGPRAYFKSDAALRMLAALPLPWKLAACGRICPAFLRDWIYDQVAKNRYSWFGRNDSCLLPTPDHERRILQGNAER